MSFLPKDYTVPSESNYMKLATGANKFRVLDSAIIGQEFWTVKDGKRKPIRRRMGEAISPSELMSDGNIKHFWAFPVWNYQAKKVQILELTQKTIMNSINALVQSEDWGDPKSFDIVITREGDGMDTEYHVMPSPKKELDPGIVQMYKDMNVDLDVLFEGGDPFAAKDEGSRVTDKDLEEAFGK